MPLLEVKNLNVTIATRRGPLEIVRDLSFSIDAGEILGIVGESGCGKSITSLAIMGLLPANAPTKATVKATNFSFMGRELLSLNESQRNQLRGKDMAMIFQDPMTSLNPCFNVEMQLTETLKLHHPESHALTSGQARDKAIELLNLVGIPSPAERLKAFPHQLSGGMSQRVMIAMAIASNPKLLIADEPTTALDVTIQAQILDLLKSLVQKKKMALLLITHDMAVVSQMADKVLVMYAGQEVEYGIAEQIIEKPKHPYTHGLLNCLPGQAGPQHEDLHRTKLKTISGMVPDLFQKADGCLFEPRCSHAKIPCKTGTVKLVEQVRCLYPLETL
jgi:dipeptide transport system ATP-binding protein